MSYPQVINEVAGAINAVINVIAGSVLKVLPILLLILIGFASLDIFFGTLLEGKSQTERPFLTKNHPAEMQLSSNETVETTAVNQE